MGNFFEKMEREINFHLEYEKIENIVLNERDYNSESINKWIERNFTQWRFKRNYATLNELRDKIGFSYVKDGNTYVPVAYEEITINNFIDYCEMLINLIFPLFKIDTYYCEKRISDVIDIIVFDLESINHKIHETNENKLIIVQKDAKAIAVADVVEANLADSIIEYNHHLLKGNLEKKKTILKKIADSLEPQRSILKKINPTIENDFFFMVNNMNVRHNNCDPTDEKRYQKVFAELSSEEQEELYDMIYQEGLMAHLLIEQEERNTIISKLKKNMGR